MQTLLVIDDEPNIHFSIGRVLADQNVRVVSAQTATDGIRLARQEAPDLILLDIRLGNSSGLDVFGDLRRINPRCLIIFMTGFGTASTAIEAMKLGAFDYLVKPLDAEQLQQVVTQSLSISRLMNVPAVIEDAEQVEDMPVRLIGNGPNMRSLCKQIGRVAPQDVNVLILGESGTGKELVARAMYFHSRRNHSPFLAINCAAIPESLLESELFGHERGAFTGADRRRIGKFEQCHGGTLFLDEIGDMTPQTQAKILRLLQEGIFERLGGSESLSADVRILAATNQDLDALIQQGRFRKDLYYRLRGVTIHLPPLRERIEDIAELAHYFLFRFNRALNTSVQSISPEALELLERHPWPGNVRELQSAIHEALIASAGTVILPEFLPLEVQQEVVDDPDADSDGQVVPDVDWQLIREFAEKAMADGEPDVYRRIQEQVDRYLIRRAMELADGQQNRAAKLLGLSRPTLRSKLRNMHLAVKRSLTSDEGQLPES
jgi:DNA-binding NtrC family response regulator